MDSKLLVVAETPFLSPPRHAVSRRLRPRPHFQLHFCPSLSTTFRLSSNANFRCFSAAAAASATVSSTSNGHSSTSKNGVYTVGDFMTTKENLAVVKPTTTVDEALESLVEKRITGFPVIDDDWKLVGLVSDYDLLALDTISGTGLGEASMFPEVDSTWKVFNELQKLLTKTNGKVVADVMTQAPVVVRETTNLDDAARLLLETRYRRLPVVDADGKLVGIITRGNCIRAALQMKRASEEVQ